MSDTDLLEKIVSSRKAVIREKGFTMGASVPEKRVDPVVPFVRDPFLVCEIKRRSPSRGCIAPGLDAVAQASLYSEKGMRSVSILTESAHFGGSLTDLMDVKKAFPGLSILRKDFLFDKEDIEVSYRAGADAVLLIASILGKDELGKLHSFAESLGLGVLVEVHGKEDIDKVKQIKPALTGINARDLRTFYIDIAYPLSVKADITWDTRLVFESGIHSQESARVALGAGFSGLLVGEGVVRKPELIGELIDAFGMVRRDFWSRLFTRRKPFVKICGMTNEEDARHAAASGADILGFVFADSKRRADPALLPKLRDLDVLKVGVVVTDGSPGSLSKEVRALLEDRLLDAVQLHGSEPPDACYSIAFPYYKAMRLKSEKEADALCDFACPRVLVDAYSEKAAGGTGENIPEALVRAAASKKPLWLAGGLDADNIAGVMRNFSPELVDVSSRLESAPGKKDRALVERFIRGAKARRGD